MTRLIGDEVILSVASFLAETIDNTINIDDAPDEFGELFERMTWVMLSEYSFTLIEYIERVFGAPVPDLRRMSKTQHVPGSLLIESKQPNWAIRVKFKASGPDIHLKTPNIRDLWPLMTRRRWSKRARANLESWLGGGPLIRDIMADVQTALFREVPNHTKYLPAARSGLMHSHKVISGSLVRRASYAGIEDMRIPAMSGVVTDFLSELIEIDSSYRSPFYPIARRLEEEVLRGSVHLVETVNSSPEIMFHTNTGDYPLTRTSSMVSELAPVVVYLKRVLREQDLLIIEEPEAHLHPQTQVVLAQILVRLVNSGLKVLITTHSEFFLQQLNNSIVAGSLSEKGAESLSLDSKVTIHASEVSAYLFDPSERGTLVARQELDNRTGVPDIGFDSVSEQLYNQNVELDRRLNAEN